MRRCYIPKAHHPTGRPHVARSYIEATRSYVFNARIRYTETDKWREKIMADLKLHHGSIFEKISIVEMGILVLLSQVASCSV